MLGLVGGFASIVWAALMIVFSNYETFKLQNSVIGSIYTTRPAGNDRRDTIIDEPLSVEENAKQTLV